MLTDRKLVHFDGDWTPDERRVTQQAIRLREPHLNVSVPTTCMIAPWVCAKEASNGVTRYLARRVNLDTTFEGRTVSELCSRLRTPTMNGSSRR